VGDKRFLLTGSTLCTQMKRLESLKPKGYWILDTQSKQLDFFPIEKQRRIVYEKMAFEHASASDVQQRLVSFLSGLNLTLFEQKPLVRVKLSGSLAKGVSSSDVAFRQWIEPFREHAFLSVDESFSEGSLRQKISELRSFQQSRTSVLDLGMELLEKNLSQTGFDASVNAREVFEELAQGDAEKALEALRQKEKGKKD
ncbi:MAG: hypothetical protein Q7R47_04535, partial [Candidatus Diapherotrites archaeon]|nr:hypothetical protein [Candidatus Diapherotrites archaeon]